MYNKEYKKLIDMTNTISILHKVEIGGGQEKEKSYTNTMQ